MINSPLNYAGNKFRILKQLIPLIDKNGSKFIDVFAGSGLVAINSGYKKIHLNDYNPVTIELLNYFLTKSHIEIDKEIDNIIKKYGFTDTYNLGKDKYPIFKYEGLSNYNREPYLKLREDYNKSPTTDKLFALIIFGFNHYIRFNSKGEFNVPVGKMDYVLSLRNKTKEYTETLKSKNIKITCLDFRNTKLYSDKEAIYYFDPPYLITNAPYNSDWSSQEEEDLLNLLDSLNKKGIKFALSNVLQSNGKVNQLLIDWSKKYNVHYLNRQYLNSNYRKKNITKAIEVLITNY